MGTLQFLAGAAGSGIAGSLLFSALRQLFPPPPTRPRQPWLLLYWLLWAPKGARISAMTLSALVMVVASGLVALATGQDATQTALGALDSALAAAGVSQLAHLPQLPAGTATGHAAETARPGEEGR